MDTTILEVVLGLVLVYAVLAVLVMKLQEELGGNLMNYRANVLHDLVLEACGGSADLKQKVLAHPLVSALYRSDKAEQRSVRRDTGPSAIPPALFAKALLAALNGDSAPGLSSQPASFLAPAAPPGSASNANATLPAADDADGKQRVWRALQTLLPGYEADWPGFEAAVALWFSDIGDRADGWFKRKASRWALVLSTLLVLLLNVDSFNIATTLGHDPALRLGLADLASRIDSQRRSDAAGQGDAPAPPSAAAQPMQQLASRMTDAITQLNSAWRSDEAIGRFRADITPVHLGCSIVRDNSALDRLYPLGQGEEASIKNSAARAAALAPKAKDHPATVVSGVLSWTASLSNADVWLRVLPIVQAKVEVAQLLDAADAERIYRRGFECVSQVSSWVRSATVASDKANVRAQMQDAAVALEAVKSALLTLSERQQASTSLQRAFLADPEAFESCRSGARSRGAFDACLQRELRSGLNLPLFWGGAAMRTQFCSAVTAGSARGGTAANGTGLLCRTAPFAGDARLDLPALHLAPREGLPWLAAIGGWTVTVLFVSLGAPFWFDLLNKVVRLRSAGAVRDAVDDTQRGRGTLPLPPPLSDGSGASRAMAGADGEAPFSDSRNRFEDGLVPATILRLQQKLPADQTGRLDQQTRVALRSWCSANGETEVEVLDEVLYTRIVGRSAAPVGASVGSARLAGGQSRADVAKLGTALMPVLRQNGRIAAGQIVFDADLRAMAVLFRYHQERNGGKAPKDCVVMRTPDRNPAQLEEIDELLAAQIETAAQTGQRITLEPPCWMDWAIGELGQVEHDAPNRAASNPRILAYLDASVPGAGNDGDHKAWCGAFVAWVLSAYDSYRQAHVADLERQGDPLAAVGAVALPTVANADWPLKASSWAAWGTPHADWRTGAEFGDVVLFKSQSKDSSGHVAFVVAWDGQQLWALGGNQSNGSRVSMQAWAADQVVAVLHI